MQKIKSIAFALVIGTAAVGLSPPTASATVILNVDASGQLTGAQNVDVGGTLFDVTFMDGTCAILFNGCNDPVDFPFITKESALLAAQALLDQVFLDSPKGQFDSNPNITMGCTAGPFCLAFIPVILPSYSLGALATAVNQSPPSTDTAEIASFPIHKDSTLYLEFTYALFARLPSPPAGPSSGTAPAAIPEPGTLLLFAGGLAILAAFGHRRRQA